MTQDQPTTERASTVTRPGDDTEARSPEFGPSGYLPQRAAHRARKIVLRAPMGLQWPIAACLAAVLVLGLGVTYLLTRTGPPGAPFVAAGQLAAIDPRGAEIIAVGERELLVVRGGGGVTAFAAPDAEADWCAESGRIEAADGSVWTVDGRRVGGRGDSLAPRRVAVHDGVLYLDPASGTPAPPPTPRGEDSACGVSTGR